MDFIDFDKVVKRIHPGWTDFFTTNKEELTNILKSINQDNNIFPLSKDIFRTLFYFGPEETKIVILGQDPYIGSELHDNKKIPQACGMSFGVPKIHKKIPPSLNNIFKEIKSCYPNSIIPKHGFLKRWVQKKISYYLIPH